MDSSERIIMKYPKYCEVQYFFKGAKVWLSYSPLTSSQSGPWCKGFVAAMMEFNKCADHRIIDYKTREVIEEFKGHCRELQLN